METLIWEKGKESGKVISINDLRFWLYNTTFFFRSSILHVVLIYYKKINKNRGIDTMHADGVIFLK